MRGKRLIASVLIAASLTACSKTDITKRDYNNIKESITLGMGITTIELENTIIKFVYNVYNPQNEQDIQNGLGLINDLVTEEEYIELESSIYYNANSKSTVSDVVAKYASHENSADGMGRLYTEFKLESNGYNQIIGIEFVINPEGKIFKHYIWQGVNSGASR